MRSKIAIHQASTEIKVQYVMEQYLLPPEERHEDYYNILATMSYDELPKELQNPGFLQLPDHGQISLSQIGEEGQVAAGSQIAINDSQCRDLIGKAAQNQMAFSEWYGASYVPPIDWSKSMVTSGPVNQRTVAEKYGTAYAREIRADITYVGGLPSVYYIGCIKQGGGQARAWAFCSSMSAAGYAASEYNKASHFKWQVDGVNGTEGPNADWNGKSYSDTAGNWYYADGLSTPAGESLWSALAVGSNRTLRFYYGF